MCGAVDNDSSYGLNLTRCSGIRCSSETYFEFHAFVAQRSSSLEVVGKSIRVVEGEKSGKLHLQWRSIFLLDLSHDHQLQMSPGGRNDFFDGISVEERICKILQTRYDIIIIERPGYRSILYDKASSYFLQN